MSAKQPKQRVIGATASNSKRDFPAGFPECLITRGTGVALSDKLQELGELGRDTVGVVLLHLHTDTGEMRGPEFVLKGPVVTMGLKPKNIWGEVEHNWDNVQDIHLMFCFRA